MAAWVLILMVGIALWIRWNRSVGTYSPSLPAEPESPEQISDCPTVTVDSYTWRPWYDAAVALDAPLRRLAIVTLFVSTLLLAVPGLLFLDGELKLSVLIYAPIIGYYIGQLVANSYRRRKFDGVAKEMRELVVPDLLVGATCRQLFTLAFNSRSFVGGDEICATTVGGYVRLETKALPRWRRGPFAYQA